MSAATRIRLGVVGLGLIAQVVHLPNLRRLADRYAVVHACDLSPTLAEAIAATISGGPRWSTDPADVFADPDVDAVLLLTPGAHGPLAAAALRAGKHVLSEKPLTITQREARELGELAREQGRVLQVAYMKWHDPAMEPARAAIRRIGAIRLVRVTVRHPDDERQTSHLDIARASDGDQRVIKAAQAFEEALTLEALGHVDPELGRLYRDVLVGSISHELSALRALGIPLPESFRSAHIWHGPEDTPDDRPSIGAIAELPGGAMLELDWLWLPHYPSYRERISIIGTAGEVTLELPEPYGHNVAAELRVELPGEPGTSQAIRREVHDSGFLAELRAFHASVTTGAPVGSDAEGARQDTACLQALAAAIERDAGRSIGGEAAAGTAAAGTAAAGMTAAQALGA